MSNKTQVLEWYIAELVMEITVEAARCNVVHRNLVLLHAESAEQAYSKAVSVGRKGETSYRNPEDRLVQIRFRGIKRLELMFEDPEDGSELTFKEQVGVGPEEIQRLIPPKEDLQVFSSPKPGGKRDPDYRSKEVMKMGIDAALRRR